MFRRLSDIDRLFGSMNRLRNRLNNLYSDFDTSHGLEYNWAIEENMPKICLYEDNDNFGIMAEVPGIAKENLHLKIQGNYLEISGNRDSDVPEGYKIHRTERGSVSFSRSLTLPAEVDAVKVEAILKNGILYLTLPKAETAKSTKILIK